jgi:medium-chain acyl-[acyl-carrier-protein] hydrolase
MQPPGSDWRLWFPFSEGRRGDLADLVCFAPGGCGAGFFQSWRELVPNGVALHALQLPGRETRFGEAARTDCNALFDELATLVARLQSARLILFGHSLGALLAYGVANRLANSPAALVVSARSAPDSPAHLSDVASRFEAVDFDSTMLDILNELEDDSRDLLLQPLRDDIVLFRTFVDEGRTVSSPLYVIGGTADATVQRADLAAWSSRTRSTFDLRFFAGDHTFVRDNALVAQFLAEICLRE